MRRVAVLLVAVVALLAAGAQLFLPTYLEGRVEDRLEQHGGSADVSLRALSAERLLFDHGDSLKVEGHGLRLRLGGQGRVLEAPGRLDEVRRELDEYFEGRRTEFDVPVDWSLTRGFGRRVLRETARISYGQVRTYTEVATGAGSPRAVRAAGNALGANPVPIVVPCHRVLRIGGNLGGYGGGLDRKEFLLKLEGALPGD